MADECFLTGTAADIIPLVRVDSRDIGDGTPDPLKLLAMFRQQTMENGGLMAWRTRLAGNQVAKE